MGNLINKIMFPIGVSEKTEPKLQFLRATQNHAIYSPDTGYDGFSQVAVDVPETGDDPYEQLIKLMKGELVYFKHGGETDKFTLYCANVDLYQQNLVFYSANNENNVLLPIGHNFHASNCKYFNLGTVTNRILAPLLFSGALNFKTIIIKNREVINLQNLNVFTGTALANGTGFLYVPDKDVNGNDLPSQYKSATNWSTYATQIKGFSEAPEYEDNTWYDIGDVCQYNYRLYGYCKKDLTPSKNKEPSGGTTDTEYWEYIGDI